MKIVKTIGLLFILFSTISFAQISIDGNMDDWSASKQIDLAPRALEDVSDSIDANWDGVMDGIINPALDVKDVFITHDNNYLYIRLDINEDGTFGDLTTLTDGGFQAAIELFIDTDVDTSTGLTWGWWLTSGDYWINLSVPNGWPGFTTTAQFGINKFTGQNGTDSQWEEVVGAEVMIAYNIDDNKMEVAIPRDALGETNGDFESTGIMVLCEDPTAAWNADAVPNSLGVDRYVYRYGNPQITIDGDMSDWPASTQLDVAPNMEEGIADSIDLNWDGVKDGIINPALDVNDVFVTHDEDYLFIRLDINEDGTFGDLATLTDGGFQAAIELFIDTDVDTSTGLTWGWWLTSGDYWINLSVSNGWPGFETTAEFGINKFTGQNGTDSQWEEVVGAEVMIAYNLDDNKMEVAIPRTALGETNGDFESTGIMVLCEDPTAGWNADAVPDDLGVYRNVYRYGRTEITIDGDMSDWGGATKFDVVPNMEEGLLDSVDSDWDGVMDGIINPALDIKDVYVSHNDEYLFVRVDINEDGTLTDLDGLTDAEGYRAPIQLYFDTDLDSATGLTWGYWLNGGDYYVNISDPDGNPGLEVTQDYGLLMFTGLNGNDEAFEEVMGGGCLVATNIDDNKIEVAIPRALIGETNGENESTGILVFAEDPTMDWVNDAAPSDDGSFRNVYNYGNPIGPVTGVEDQRVLLPNEYDLAQNYPNPFNPTTTIKYSLGTAQKVNLAVYNILGQKVATLFNGLKNAGNYSVKWSGKNSNGVQVPSGIYFYSMHATEGMITKKMILLK